jgi:hypothetical protein
MESRVVSASLASDGRDAVNTVFDPASGSASIGVDYHHPSYASWTISPSQIEKSGQTFLYVMADEPQFFSPSGFVSVMVGSASVEEIKSVPTPGTSRFAADTERQTILIPPARTLGYRIALGAGRCAERPCDVSVRGAWTFWHVYRIAVTREYPRFASR